MHFASPFLKARNVAILVHEFPATGKYSPQNSPRKSPAGPGVNNQQNSAGSKVTITLNGSASIQVSIGTHGGRAALYREVHDDSCGFARLLDEPVFWAVWTRGEVRAEHLTRVPKTNTVPFECQDDQMPLACSNEVARWRRRNRRCIVGKGNLRFHKISKSHLSVPRPPPERDEWCSHFSKEPSSSAKRLEILDTVP